MQTQAGEEKEPDVTSGIAAIVLESSTSVPAQPNPTIELMEPRSSSAMAEFRVDSIPNRRLSLPHSVSSPALTLLTPGPIHHVNLANGGFASSGAASLATSQQNLRSLLPAYRQAPDYETAVRIKYGDEIAQLLLNPPVQAQQVQQSQQQPLNQQMQMMNMYKPPPPYPYSKVSSNSSPDLAGLANGSALMNPSTSVDHLGDTQNREQAPTTVLRNGEPIYQNIPLRQPGSQPNLAHPNNNNAGQGTTPTRRKWGINVLQPTRSAVINSPSPSASSKRSVNEQQTNYNAQPQANVVPPDVSNTKDLLVSYLSLKTYLHKLTSPFFSDKKLSHVWRIINF